MYDYVYKFGFNFFFGNIGEIYLNLIPVEFTCHKFNPNLYSITIT